FLSVCDFIFVSSQVVAGLDIVLPSDEIWLCDLDSGMEQREMTGDIPPHLSSFCGANINTKLYIFGGYEEAGYSNQMFSVDLTEPRCTWKRVTDTKGTTPSPRNKHSCWVHRDRSATTTHTLPVKNPSFTPAAAVCVPPSSHHFVCLRDVFNDI
uniref:Uncharacterized protein n=1 Tax=Amphilophus citrinellus TaxID=61819 RepID=A0A3Q0THS4_AMPCI